MEFQEQTSPIKTINDLPVELIEHVMSFLDFSSIIESTLVCRKWNEIISNSPHLLKDVRLMLTIFSPPTLQSWTKLKDFRRNYHEISFATELESKEMMEALELCKMQKHLKKLRVHQIIARSDQDYFFSSPTFDLSNSSLKIEEFRLILTNYSRLYSQSTDECNYRAIISFLKLCGESLKILDVKFNKDGGEFSWFGCYTGKSERDFEILISLIAAKYHLLEYLKLDYCTTICRNSNFRPLVNLKKAELSINLISNSNLVEFFSKFLNIEELAIKCKIEENPTKEVMRNATKQLEKLKRFTFEPNCRTYHGLCGFEHVSFLKAELMEFNEKIHINCIRILYETIDFKTFIDNNPKLKVLILSGNLQWPRNFQNFENLIRALRLGMRLKLEGKRMGIGWTQERKELVQSRSDVKFEFSIPEN